MISFQNITKKYFLTNDNTEITSVALDDVSFDVAEKEFVSIVGKSGAGKTTLLKLLLVQEKPTSGDVFFEKQNINNIKPENLPELRRKIGSVFQDYKLISSKTVYENVSYIMEVIGSSDEEIKRDVPRVLNIVGLGDKLGNFPAQLSGGEKQRVAIARALIHRPIVILADEPTGNLDTATAQEVFTLFKTVMGRQRTIIAGTHNQELAKLADRIIYLKDGKIESDQS